MNNPKTIIVFAPHPDDEILGVGGTVRRLILKGYMVTVCVVTKGCLPIFTEQSVLQTRKEQRQAHDILGINKTIFLDYPAAMLESVPRYQINDSFINLIQEEKPEVVFMPHAYDMQKDHQIVANAVMVAVRPKYNYRVGKVLAYETLSETEWNIPNHNNCFIPNLYVDVSSTFDDKMNALKCFISQLSDFPNPRSLEAVEALAKYRGSTIMANRAEAFEVIREVHW